jgi:hypothetical protein
MATRSEKQQQNQGTPTDKKVSAKNFVDWQ